MIRLIRREFIVEQPIAKAWQHLGRLAEWPSWAKHMQQVQVQPPGMLSAKSTALIYLRNGVRCAFQVTEFNPNQNWKWVGGFLWATVHYDHRFEEQSTTQTKLTWTVEAEGFGVSLLGKLFAKVYNRNLERAIPLLVAEINAGSA
jgi:hypothetical protein